MRLRDFVDRFAAPEINRGTAGAKADTDISDSDIQ